MSTSKKSILKCKLDTYIKDLRSIDLFGQNILLNLNGEDQYKTGCGGMMTLVILAIVVLFFQSNIKDFVDKVNIQSESNQVFEDQPDSIYLNDTNFMFAVAIEQPNFNSNPFFNITLSARQYERLGNGSLSKTEALIDLVPCTIQRFQQVFSSYGQNFTQQYNEIGLDTWLCPQMNYQITLNGRYTNKFFNFLKITVTQCSNQSQTNSFYSWQPACASTEEVQHWLLQQRQYRIKVYQLKHNYRYITNQMVSPSKGDDYVQSFLDDELFFSFVPQMIGKEADVFFTKYSMKTDNNLLPTESAFDTKELFAKQSGDYRDQNNYASDTFAQVYFRRSPYTTYIQRSYQKLDKLLSILGGFANIVFVVLGFIVAIYNKQLYLIELANQIYDFNPKKENQEKAERQRLVEDITQLKSQNLALNRCSPISSLNLAKPQIEKNLRLTFRQTFSQKFDYISGIQTQKDDSYKMVLSSHRQPVGDKEVEWQSADAIDVQNNYLLNASDMVKEDQEDQRASKVKIDMSKKKSFKQIQQSIVSKLGHRNRKEFLTKQIQAMLDRSRPIVFTFKFLLQQLFCGKFFQDHNSILLNKAIKKINQDIDICVLIDKVKEIELIKELLLNKDQKILFNFAPKEVISIENERSLPGRRENKRAYTKTLGVQFGDVAKMMLDKKFKKGQFVTPGMRIYYKLYSAYERVALSEERNNPFNKVLIEKLGQEVKEVFDISNYIQGDQNAKVIEKLKKKKTNYYDEEQPIGIISMEQKDQKQSMIK
ncbi:unnamed protein product (macronuclear) [Paramecium tetraurelia]|uniref:Transmembrane protein n=1 Tax=Paramecium tetraurelia TaxID=5888 RepID=A0DDS4_PARTE|nr:uncharacterized protein GSPATT00016032001 [Paramecium tetraurelia]CAK81191.1 unnamed protein product [Paramecium tetraurelia]|eukprot:XP_001448588.1 hypothetical protein (macronuclear) [Paramecium tetraurelia strain d4-2]